MVKTRAQPNYRRRDQLLEEMRLDALVDWLCAPYCQSGGWQMLGIVPVPAVTPPVVDHTYGGGALAVEAANWLAAAVARYEATPRVRAETTLSIGDTLAALVFDRGASGLTETNLTLFGFRPADAGLQKPLLADLRSLAASTSTSPAYDLRGMLKVITDRVITARPPDPWVKLENLLLQIYAIGGLGNNLAPGLYPSPSDAFRAFLLTGELTGAYASAVGISAADLNDAYVSVHTLLRGIYRSPRPVSELDLTVEAEVADRLDGPFVPAAGGSTRQNGDWMEIRELAPPASPAFCRVAMSLK